MTSEKLIAKLKIGHANAPSFDNVCVCARVCVCVLCWSGRHVLYRVVLISVSYFDRSKSGLEWCTMQKNTCCIVRGTTGG